MYLIGSVGMCVGCGAGEHTSVSARPGSNWSFSEDLKKLSSMELTACIRILALTSTYCVIFDPEPPFPCL